MNNEKGFKEITLQSDIIKIDFCKKFNGFEEITIQPKIIKRQFWLSRRVRWKNGSKKKVRKFKGFEEELSPAIIKFINFGKNSGIESFLDDVGDKDKYIYRRILNLSNEDIEKILNLEDRNNEKK